MHLRVADGIVLVFGFGQIALRRIIITEVKKVVTRFEVY